ncbi:MAG: hypothetical protein ACRD2R_01590 [Terriglobales bacterium]
MNRYLSGFLFFLLAVGSAAAAALGTAARSVIPAEVQQIISVDYRKMGASSSAMALKQRALPQHLKQFETALRGVGINPDSDLDQLTFASFRTPKSGLRTVGVAQGQFPAKAVLQKIRRSKKRGEKYRGADLYPMGESVRMAFLDDFTLVFGDAAAVRTALDTRDGEGRSLNSNSQITDLIPAVEAGALWSVLDASGTQNMLRSSLGEAAGLADFETVRKRLLGSRYAMDFEHGVDFDLDVLTSDNFSAATLSSLIQAGVLFRKMSATGAEKTTLDSLTVKSESGRVTMHFETDEKRFQALLQSDLFSTISR